jgi:hypothetical protein
MYLAEIWNKYIRLFVNYITNKNQSMFLNQNSKLSKWSFEAYFMKYKTRLIMSKFKKWLYNLQFLVESAHHF